MPCFFWDMRATLFCQTYSKLMPLPPDTAVYCAHEYTASNAEFAASVDPDNAGAVACVCVCLSVVRGGWVGE